MVTVQMSFPFLNFFCHLWLLYFFCNKKVDEDGAKIVVVVVVVDHVAAVIGMLKRQRSKKKTKEVNMSWPSLLLLTPPAQVWESSQSKSLPSPTSFLYFLIATSLSLTQNK